MFLRLHQLHWLAMLHRRRHLVVDAERYGNHARFANHSDKPNSILNIQRDMYPPKPVIHAGRYSRAQCCMRSYVTLFRCPMRIVLTLLFLTPMV